MNFNKASNYSLISLAALALILSPNLAHAHNTPITGGHMHTVAFHDRTPHVHDRTPVAHH
jgi:hypothetical protein